MILILRFPSGYLPIKSCSKWLLNQWKFLDCYQRGVQIIQVASLKYRGYESFQLKFLARLIPVTAASSPPLMASSVSLPGAAEPVVPVALTSPATPLFHAQGCQLPLLFLVSTKVGCAFSPILAAFSLSHWTSLLQLNLHSPVCPLLCFPLGLLSLHASGQPHPQVTCAEVSLISCISATTTCILLLKS